MLPHFAHCSTGEKEKEQIESRGDRRKGGLDWQVRLTGRHWFPKGNEDWGGIGEITARIMDI